MSDMTPTEASTINSRLDDVKSSLDRLTSRVDALPDKAAIYTAALAIHGVIWVTIIGTVSVLGALGLIVR